VGVRTSVAVGRTVAFSVGLGSVGVGVGVGVGSTLSQDSRAMASPAPL